MSICTKENINELAKYYQYKSFIRTELH